MYQIPGFVLIILLLIGLTLAQNANYTLHTSKHEIKYPHMKNIATYLCAMVKNWMPNRISGRGNVKSVFHTPVNRDRQMSDVETQQLKQNGIIILSPANNIKTP